MWCSVQSMYRPPPTIRASRRWPLKKPAISNSSARMAMRCSSLRRPWVSIAGNSSGLGQLFGEPVARTAHGLYQSIVVAERLAQAPDVHVHGALIHVDVAAPDVVENLVAGVHPILVGQKE